MAQATKDTPRLHTNVAMGRLCRYTSWPAKRAWSIPIIIIIHNSRLNAWILHIYVVTGTAHIVMLYLILNTFKTGAKINIELLACYYAWFTGVM